MRILYKISLNTVKVLTLLLSVLLFAGSFIVTCYADNMETQKVLFRFDSPFWNLLEIIGYGLLFMGCLYLFSKIGKKFCRGMLFFTLGAIMVLGIALIIFGRTVPAADALSVYNAAAEWILGNTAVIHPADSYLSYYPQQIGLMAFLEVLLRAWYLTGLSVPAWHFIKFVYVCLLCVAVVFQYRSLQYLWPGNWEPLSCCYLVLVCCNLPMIMYSSFVYGEIPSFAALSAGLYLLLKLLAGFPAVCPVNNSKENDCKVPVAGPGCSSATIPEKACRINSRCCTGIAPEIISSKLSAWRNRYTAITAAGSILFLTLSVMLRKNSLIPIIAVLLVLLFEALRSGRSVRMRLGLLLMAVCLAVTSVGILPLVQKCYEEKAGSTLSSGVTAMSYFAMGMQEASRGCGWYNGFNIDTYDAAGMDSGLADEISRQAISERLEYFREHPGYALHFYLGKHLSQWTDGTYASRQATLATYGGRSRFFHEVYEGSLSRAYIEWGNAWQNVLYLGCLLFCIVSWRNCKKSGVCSNLYIYVGLIAVLGGFLFHIIWEANSRYIFSYSLLLMPYCAAGIHTGIRKVLPLMQRLLRRLQ